MADIIKGLFGAQKPVNAPAGDDDFADFAGAPDPSPASILAESPSPISVKGAAPTAARLIPYTKWYRVWERTQPSDFIAEALILPFIIVVVGLHAWGRTTNKAKARQWAVVHVPELKNEFVSIGFGDSKEVQTDTSNDAAEDALKEKTASEFLVYATGRQNVAFLDIHLLLYKRYNPATLIVESIMSFFIESIRPPAERLEATAYSFDGRESELVPAKSQEQLDSIQAQSKAKSSTYDPFIWAVVHKEYMKTLREDRYDLSITTTKDNAKLPAWATVMTESSEITDQLLTPELISAVEVAGDAFEYLIVTDQPIDKPQSLSDVKPSKRVSISLAIPSSSSAEAYAPTLPIFRYYLRLPDQLANSARFRPEVRKKITAVREEEQKKLKKADETEKAEDRRAESDKKKKEIRDNRLKGLSADEQRKFLDKERERSNKKAEKKMSRKA